MRLQFFATKEDLMKIFNNYDMNMDIKYVPYKIYLTPEYTELKTLSNVDTIGVNFNGQAKEQSYNIYEKNKKVKISAHKQINSDATHYFAHGVITLFVGGIYNNQALLMSEINTLGESEDEVKLYKTLVKYIKKQCNKKLGGVSYSDQVVEIGKTMRLVYNTISSPIEYDIYIK